jgi:GxxExxY protein
VLNELRPGLDEKLYERALVLELQSRGVAVNQQKAHNVFYRGTLIGQLIPDLLVGDLVIVDLKVVKAFTDEHVSQMLGYLAITGLNVGLLLNFKYPTLGVKRVVV